jgi:hypothetical protein
MNIKYYKFDSSFDTSEFYSENVYVDVETIYSTIQGNTLS